MRLSGLLVAALISAGSTAVARDSDRSAALEAAVASITDAELREHAGLLADDTLEGRAAGTRGGLAAARYLEKKMKEAGLKPAGDNGSFIQRFGSNYLNIVGVLPGSDPMLGSEYIVIGAHFDHVGYGNRGNSNGPIGYIHNGADDNASGVAVLLEVIDAFHRTGWQPRRSIVFAFWDGEEINLLGSRHWVRQPTVPREKVRLAINADMVGRLTNGRLEIAGARTAEGLRRLLSSSQLPENLKLDFTWEYKENSDHWPFYEAGIPSLLIHTGLHGDYHRPSDDIEKLNIAGMRLTSAYLVDTLFRLADVESLPSFRSACRSETVYTRAQREKPLAPAAPRLGLKWKWTPAADETVAADEEGAIVDRAGSLRVIEVVPVKAAERAGIKVGDVIAAIDGKPLAVEERLPAAVLRAATNIQLEVVRAGQDEPLAIGVALDGEPTQLGLSWRPDSGNPGAVFITRVVPYSPAARAGIAVHDRIYAVDGEPFADHDALLTRVRQLLDEGAESLTFEVETAGRIRPIAVDLRLPTARERDPSL